MQRYLPLCCCFANHISSYSQFTSSASNTQDLPLYFPYQHRVSTLLCWLSQSVRGSLNELLSVSNCVRVCKLVIRIIVSLNRSFQHCLCYSVRSPGTRFTRVKIHRMVYRIIPQSRMLLELDEWNLEQFEF